MTGMRAFFQAWPIDQILQTPSGESDSGQISESQFRKSADLASIANRFPLPWSAYVRLLKAF
jgi:hypothetical protein